MRISVWSSDVCSSDLLHMLVGQKLVADDSILDADARVHLADGGDLARRRRHAQQIVKDDAALDVVDLPERRRQADAIAFERTVAGDRSEEHTSELQSIIRISYAVFCLKKKKT